MRRNVSEVSAREAVTAAALRGDVAMLRAVAADLPPRESHRYDRHRASAFAAALEGDRDGAFTALALGGVESAQRRDLDVAIIELLLGNPARALATVRAAVSGTAGIEPDATAVLAECVRRGGGSAREGRAPRDQKMTKGQRRRSAAAVFHTFARDPFEATLPLLSLVALSIAIVALLRLPSLLDGDDWSLPTPRDRQPVVVVAQPSPVEVSPRPRPRQEREAAVPAPSTPASVAVVARRASGVAPAHRVATPRRPTTPIPPATPPEESQPAGPEVRVLASQAAPSVEPATPAPATTAAKPTHEPRGRALGRQKRAQREQTAPAPFSAPDPSPADVPAAANPGPPEHANGHGRDEAPGQRKKP
jgi:hypothetical protein